MRITNVIADNILSFDHLEISFKDSRPTIIVGPNGAGKSNVVQLFSLARAALDSAAGMSNWLYNQDPTSSDAILRSYARARYRRAQPDDPVRIEIDIELTSDTERDQVACFMRAAILNAFLEAPRWSDENEAQLVSWIMEEVTVELLAELERGTLVCQHSGSEYALWEISYEFIVGDSKYEWLLATKRGLLGIQHAAMLTPSGGRSYIDKWFPMTALFGIGQNNPRADLTQALSDHNFSFAYLCPPPHAALDLHVTLDGQHFEPRYIPLRRFAEMVGAETPRSEPNRRLSFATVLQMVFQRGLVLAGEQLRGVPAATIPATSGHYTMDQLTQGDQTLNPAMLPLRLFGLKNGIARDRERYGMVQSTFQNLAPGRYFDVSFRLSTSRSASNYPPISPPPADSEQSPPLELTAEITPFIREEPEVVDWELPIQFAGAGVWEALVLAEAIADSSDRVIVLDEPALNLHAGWQRLLIRELRNGSGQFVVITHSSYLVPMNDQEDLDCLVRLARGVTGATQGYRLPSVLRDDTDGSDLRKRIVKEYSAAADARALLFTDIAVLVEGETELGLFPRWFDRISDEKGEGARSSPHLGFFSVRGDKNFTAPLALLAALDIPWAIICDGAPFGPEAGGNHIFKQVIKAGAATDDLKDFVKEKLGDNTEISYETVVVMGAQHGIFTLAAEPTKGKEGIEAFIRSLGGGVDALERADGAVGSSKVRQGIWIADNVPPPEQVEKLYGQLHALWDTRSI